MPIRSLTYMCLKGEMHCGLAVTEDLFRVKRPGGIVYQLQRAEGEPVPVPGLSPRIDCNIVRLFLQLVFCQCQLRSVSHMPLLRLRECQASGPGRVDRCFHEANEPVLTPMFFHRTVSIHLCILAHLAQDNIL